MTFTQISSTEFGVRALGGRITATLQERGVVRINSDNRSIGLPFVGDKHLSVTVDERDALVVENAGGADAISHALLAPFLNAFRNGAGA